MTDDKRRMVKGQKDRWTQIIDRQRKSVLFLKDDRWKTEDDRPTNRQIDGTPTDRWQRYGKQSDTDMQTDWDI